MRADGSTNQKPVRQTAQLEKHRNHQVAQEKSSKQQDQKVRRGEKVARDHQQPGARTEPEHDPSLEEQKRVKVKPLQEGDLSQVLLSFSTSLIMLVPSWSESRAGQALQRSSVLNFCANQCEAWRVLLT